VLPSKIIAGDTATWIQDKTKDELGNDLTSVLWDMKYQFRKSGAAVVDLIEVTGTARQDGGWDFSYAVPGTLSPGTYYFSARAIKKADTTIKKTIADGQMEFVGNIAGTASFDGRTQARKDLEAVQAAMRAIISGGAIEEYTVGTRSIRKMKMEDLILLESKLKTEVVREEKAERIAQGLGNPNNVFVRFK
jgi:hypothetical protein